MRVFTCALLEKREIFTALFLVYPWKTQEKANRAIAKATNIYTATSTVFNMPTQTRRIYQASLFFFPVIPFWDFSRRGEARRTKQPFPIFLLLSCLLLLLCLFSLFSGFIYVACWNFVWDVVCLCCKHFLVIISGHVEVSFVFFHKINFWLVLNKKKFKMKLYACFSFICSSYAFFLCHLKKYIWKSIYRINHALNNVIRIDLVCVHQLKYL